MQKVALVIIVVAQVLVMIANISGSSHCGNRPHMSKDLRWEAIHLSSSGAAWKPRFKALQANQEA